MARSQDTRNKLCIAEAAAKEARGMSQAVQTESDGGIEESERAASEDAAEKEEMHRERAERERHEQQMASKKRDIDSSER